MHSIKAIVLLFTLVFFLTSCSGGSSGTSDTGTLSIGRVYTDISQLHPSFYDKWGTTPNRTIRFLVSAEVSDPKGTNNLSDLYFRDKASNRYWSMLGGPDAFAKEECYISSLDIYECRYYSSISLDRINLNNWEIIAENKQGEVSRKDFEFLLPGGDFTENEQFIYSRVYSGSTENGVAALEAMTIANNGLEFSSNSSSQSFHIEFESTDDRAKHYGFYFYDGTVNINNIGEAPSNSPSIESKPIVQGQKTVIDIPWSEIRMYGDATISQINGLHVTLYDEPIEWINNGSWFNHISLSEFLTLSP